MSVDLSQFFQVFFEEAAEHLASMESLLLELDVSNPAMEDLNAIFRAAHSIKGGAGTFGFTDMIALTHELETLLDKLRNQEIHLTDTMLDVFLQAKDAISMQLAAHRGEGDADQEVIGDVCTRLKQLYMEVPPDTGRQSMASSSAARQDPEQEHDDYGFFDPLPESFPSSEGEDYGFFETIQPPRAIDEQEAYGFFISASSAEQQKHEVPDPGYGFFADDSHHHSSQDHGQGYGFFEPAAGLAKSPQVADGSEKVAAKHVQQRNTVKPGTSSNEQSSIRVSIEKVDQLINLVGELVITQAMLAQSAAYLDPSAYERIESGLNQLERNTRDIQESIMSVRMLPMSFVFSRFPRVVRDLAGKLSKQVELKTFGESTELDKALIERLADPMTHLIRNSLDHGIETPERRIAAGKSEQGTITLNAYHQGGNIVIEVEDDGGGLNRNKILAKARERGLAVNDNMSDEAVWMLIFEAGFSTAEAVTDVSGRGVGMDVVKRNIAEMGGRVELSSVEGYGTRTTIRLPLTLAILDGLSILVGGQIFILPLASIVESLQVTDEELKSVSGDGRLLRVRGEYLPMVMLHEVFSIENAITDPKLGIAVFLESGGKKTALLVDELLGQHQVVIKSLESNFRKVHGMSGATIMGDGTVALILDVAALSAETELLAQAA